jgi:hypothetical protein
MNQIFRHENMEGSLAIINIDPAKADNNMTEKDIWIQKAKALLFDCNWCVDSEPLRKEIADLIEEGGGYDPMNESSQTLLIWERNE